jgi:hypothetical protein
VDKLIAAAASDAAPAPAVLTLATMAAWMKASGAKCPHCGASGPKGLGPPRDVNLLFSTRVGPVTPASTQGALLVAGKPLDHRRKCSDIWVAQASVRDERVGARRGVCGGGARHRRRTRTVPPNPLITHLHLFPKAANVLQPICILPHAV